jgi:hypothetical protein
MGIVSILFLIFGWCFAVKGLVITSLVISALFILILTICSFSNIDDDTKLNALIENITQFIVLILSIVKLVKGF